MEDFGYSKQKEETAFSTLVKRVFLIGATLFSLASFGYVTINAYYFFSNQNNNVETIKPEANPIKIVEEEIKNEDGTMKIDASVYEDIFGNKAPSNKEIKVERSPTPALPPLQKEEIKKDIVISEDVRKNQDNQKQNVQNSGSSKEVVNKNTITENQDLKRDLKPENSKTSNDKRKSIRVQVAALTSRKAAEDYAIKIQHFYPSLFSGLKSIIEEVDLGKRGIFYRLQIGNFFDQNKAEEFCNRYISQSQKSKADCIIVE